MITTQVDGRALSMPGVRVTLRQGYDNLNVLPNGFVNTISRVAPHGDVIIEIEFEDENPNVFFPILIDPSTREVTELKCASGGGPSRIARFTRTDKGWIKVRHTGEIRFLVVSPEGECELWNIALVPQKENLFLIFQRMFRETVYTYNGEIGSPVLYLVKAWKNINSFIGNKFADSTDGIRFPDLADYSPVPKPAPVDGEVIHYSLKDQTGAVMTRKGPAKVHYSSVVKARDGLRYLIEGERVKYDLTGVTPKHGSQRETTFEWEVKNVSLVQQ